MYIRVRGVNQKITPKEIRYAAEWMGSLIMSSQLRKNLTLTINFKAEKDHLGSTEITDYEDRLPRKFLILLDPKSPRTSTIKTLAHELVHVKQFARGEMVDLVRTKHIKWNKQYIDQDKVDYWDLPWEIEAFGREYGMYRRYINHVREEKIQF